MIYNPLYFVPAGSGNNMRIEKIPKTARRVIKPKSITDDAARMQAIEDAHKKEAFEQQVRAIMEEDARVKRLAERKRILEESVNVNAWNLYLNEFGHYGNYRYGNGPSFAECVRRAERAWGVRR